MTWPQPYSARTRRSPQLQAALANRDPSTTITPAAPTFQQPSLESFQRIMEQSMEKMMRSMLASNLDTQRRLAEHAATVPTKPILSEAEDIPSEIVKSSRKKNRKTRKSASPPNDEVASSRAPHPEPEISQAAEDEINVEDSSSDSLEDPQLNSTVISLNVSNNEGFGKGFYDDLSDNSPETTITDVPIATSTPHAETGNNTPPQAEAKKPAINQPTAVPRTPKRSFAEINPFEPGRPKRHLTQPNIQRQRQERSS